MRLEKLRLKMSQANLAGVLITRPENRRYLSGFTGSSGVLIITHSRQALATDSRYYQQVKTQCPGWELIEVGYDFAGNLPDLLREIGLDNQHVGFEATDISVATFQNWERALQGRSELVQTENLVESLRMQKDASEIASLKEAIALADQAMEHLYRYIRPGLTERQVAWELERSMRLSGASSLSFPPTVASGPNTIKPHAGITDRVIEKGEPITIDMGCVVNGYCSDITRSFCIGQPVDEKYLSTWNVVKEAQEAAIEATQGGMTGADVDKVARHFLEGAGFGEYFGHGLGHGLGLAVHESPRFSYTYPDEVPADAVMTVEPGVYIPGWGGIRIEDVVLVQHSGVEVLTTASKLAIID
jgi:Xaa-Pro aminopeptidase